VQFQPRSKRIYCYKSKSANAAYENNLYYILKTIQNLLIRFAETV